MQQPALLWALVAVFSTTHVGRRFFTYAFDGPISPASVPFQHPTPAIPYAGCACDRILGFLNESLLAISQNPLLRSDLSLHLSGDDQFAQETGRQLELRRRDCLPVPCRFHSSWLIRADADCGWCCLQRLIISESSHSFL